MWTYSLIWMGPINSKWIAENGEQWSSGRIECYNSNNVFGWSDVEYGLCIDSKDWSELDEWLEKQETLILLSFEELITLFEKTQNTSVINFKVDEF